MQPKDLARPEYMAINAPGLRRILDSTSWVAQEKLDGWRCLWDGKRGWTRHGGRIAGVEGPDNVVIDGEWIGGRLVAFDLLEARGRDLRSRPLAERWMRLCDLSGVEVVPCAIENKRDTYYEWLKRGAEGMVLKRLLDKYPPLDGAVWIKVKP